jgi:hypothetical protein
MVHAAMDGALLFFRLPPNAPMAVRQADTITTSFIIAHPFQNGTGIFQKKNQILQDLSPVNE